ncbi:MAG: non-ribosomal peptide synthetase [bacterium]
MHTLIHRAFEARASDEIVLVAGDRRLTGRALDAAANGIAHALVARGIRPGDRVGLHLQRSPEATAAILGILKAGARWVPLDPAHPEARLGFVVQDAGIEQLVTRPADAEEAAALAGRPPLVVDAVPPADRPPVVGPPPDDGLYVLYTSGSTGRPKGVCGTHGAALNRFAWMWRAFPFAPGEVLAHRASLDFVDSVWELFGGLLGGVPTAIIDPVDAVDPRRLVEGLAAAGATRVVLVPSMLQALLTALPEVREAVPAVHHWTVSGEPLSPELLRRFRACVPGATLLNLYGSTEVAADVTCAVFSEDADFLQDPVPIGRAVDHAVLHVVDETGAPVADGRIGELVVAGPVLATGYLGRPDETARRFLPDPERPGGLRFRTGDRVWRDADGVFFHAGRVDHQVKIRGVRIELEGVEHAVRRVAPDAEHVIAVVQRDADGAQRLVVFLTPAAVDAEAVREALADRLPAYQVPSRIHALDTLPRTPTGKLDRQALCALRPRRRRRVDPLRQAIDATEAAIAAVWAEHLELDAVERDADFRALGGDSLLWVSTLADVHARLGQTGPLVDAPLPSTVEALAAWYRTAHSERAFDFTIEPLTAEDAAEVAEAMAAWFAARDPSTVALDVPEPAFLTYAHAIIRRCLRTSFSLVARAGGRLVGFCVSDDFAAPIDYTGVEATVEPVIDLNDGVERRYRALRGDPVFGEVLELPMAAATPDVDGYSVLYALERRALEDGSARGYRRAVAFCTHPVTDFLARSLGFQGVVDLDYATYEYRGEPVLASLAPGRAWMMERPLGA